MAFSATEIIQKYAPVDINEKLLRVNGPAGNHGKEYGKNLMKNALEERIGAIDTDTCAAGDEDAFFVADMGEVYRQHLRWKMNLKRVKPHYGAFSSIVFTYHKIGLICISCQVQPRPRSPSSACGIGHRFRLCIQVGN